MLAPVQSTAAEGRDRGQEPAGKRDDSSIRASGEETGRSVTATVSATVSA